MVDLLHDMGYLYAVLEVFTRRFLPEWREGFEGVVASIEQMGVMQEGRERQWIMRREEKDVEVARRYDPKTLDIGRLMIKKDI